MTPPQTSIVKDTGFATATDKKMVTVLSIDGGGVRGIIPAVILDFLEEELKTLEEIRGKGCPENVRVADYFDVIAGTSTGSIVTAMLTAPDEKDPNRPRFTSADIINSYVEDSQQIFSEQSKSTAMIEEEPAVEIQLTKRTIESNNTRTWSSTIMGKLRDMVGKAKTATEVFLARVILPKYDGLRLHETITKRLKGVTLDRTVKPVVVPAFWIDKSVPYVFTTSQAKKQKQKISLCDVVLSSTAAPTYFPHHTVKVNGENCKFADGGLAANNPALLAVGEATNYGARLDGSNCMVLSLGTGSGKPKPIPEGLDGNLLWALPSKGITPRLLDVLFDSVTEMVSRYVARIFRDSPNYLRIQEYELADELDRLDSASPKDLKALENAARDLMKKPMSVMDPDTGKKIERTRKTNGDALKEFAEKLWQEKKWREDGRSAHLPVELD